MYADGKIYTCIDQRLARVPADATGRQADPQAATARRRTKSPARRSFRTAGSICRPAAHMYCLGRRTIKARGRCPAGAAGRNARRDRRRRRPGCRSCRAKRCSSRATSQQFTVRLYNARGQLLKESAGEVHARRARADRRRTANSRPPATPTAHGHDRHGQGGRADRPGADSRRAAAALEVRLQRRRGAGHLGRRPLSPP